MDVVSPEPYNSKRIRINSAESAKPGKSWSPTSARMDSRAEMTDMPISSMDDFLEKPSVKRGRELAERTREVDTSIGSTDTKLWKTLKSTKDEELRSLRRRIDALVEDAAATRVTQSLIISLVIITAFLFGTLLKCNLMLKESAAELAALRIALAANGVEVGDPIYQVCSDKTTSPALGMIFIQVLQATFFAVFSLVYYLIKTLIVTFIQMIMSVIVIPALIYIALRRGYYAQDMLAVQQFSRVTLLPMLKNVPLSKILQFIRAEPKTTQRPEIVDIPSAETSSDDRGTGGSSNGSFWFSTAQSKDGQYNLMNRTEDRNRVVNDINIVDMYALLSPSGIRRRQTRPLLESSEESENSVDGVERFEISPKISPRQ